MSDDQDGFFLVQVDGENKKVALKLIQENASLVSMNLAPEDARAVAAAISHAAEALDAGGGTSHWEPPEGGVWELPRKDEDDGKDNTH